MKNSEEYQNDFSVRSDFINTSKSQLEGSANMFSPLKLLVAIAILFFAFPSCNAILAQDFVDDTITVHELKSLVSKDSIVDMGLSVDWANFNIGAKSVVDNGADYALFAGNCANMAKISNQG